MLKRSNHLFFMTYICMTSPFYMATCTMYTRLAKWASGEAERKRKEAEEKLQRLERKRAGPKHNFDDTSYMEQIKSSEEEMGGALKQGAH